MDNSLTISPKLDTLSPLNYSSLPEIVPKKRRVKEKYFKIYTDYVTLFLTYKQLGVKYRMTLNHVAKIIKWVVFELDKGKPNVSGQRQVTMDQLNGQLRKLEALQGTLKMDAANVKKKVSIQAEIRRTIKLINQVSGLLREGINIDLSDRRSLEMHTAPGFARRGGGDGGVAPAEDVDVEQEVENDSEV